MTKFTTTSTVCKVDEALGLIIGYAIVCKQGGEDYYDLQGDHITEQAMLEASTEFAKSARVATEMHAREGGRPVRGGAVVHTFPLTSDIAKSLGIESERTGLLVAVQPNDPEVLEKARRGDFTGFSIGGERIEDEEVD